MPKGPGEYHLTRTLVGLGSNQGDSVAIVRAAAARLRPFADTHFACSSLWRTSPVDCPPGSADFINAAVVFVPHPGLTPEALLQALKALEAEFGRAANVVRHAPRELDLDLLVFGRERRDTETFVLPHPRATQRRFVLEPVAEIAPDLIWPGTGSTVAQLRDELYARACVEQVERIVLGSDESVEGRDQGLGIKSSGSKGIGE